MGVSSGFEAKNLALRSLHSVHTLRAAAFWQPRGNAVCHQHGRDQGTAVRPDARTALAIPAPALSAAQAVAAALSIQAALFDEAGQVDATGALPSRSLALLHACGLLPAPLPESAGGAGLNAPLLRRSLLHVLAHLGRGSMPVGRLYEGHVNALVLIEAFAATDETARWFADAAAGHLFAVWNTEGAGGDCTVRRPLHQASAGSAARSSPHGTTRADGR